MEDRLSFIVGGVQKAGTTSLFGYLSDHPSLMAPASKELHIFDDEMRDWTTKETINLDRHFRSDRSNRLAFDVTPIYIFWPSALERIQRYNPDIKLIFIFRDPIERAWSHWRMETSRNAETLPFSAAIRQGRWRLRALAQNDPSWRVYSYVERGFYGAQVRRVLNILPRQNLLFLKSDALQEAHMSVLGQIASFLNISPFPAVPPRLDHQGTRIEGSMTQDDVEYLRSIFRDDLILFSRLTGLAVDNWLTLSSHSRG